MPTLANGLPDGAHAVLLAATLKAELLADGDRVVIDVTTHSIDLFVSPEELERRQSAVTHPAPLYTTGVLEKFARMAQGAEKGAVTSA